MTAADFTGAKLDGSDFTATDFSYGRLLYANFRGAGIDRCVFEGCDLTQAVFDGVTYKGGRFDKANTIKGFLDPQLRAAKEVNFEATYTLTFPSGLSLLPAQVEAFQKNLTRYGSGEAYVEAHAAAQEVAG